MGNRNFIIIPLSLSPLFALEIDVETVKAVNRAFTVFLGQKVMGTLSSNVNSV